MAAPTAGMSALATVASTGPETAMPVCADDASWRRAACGSTWALKVASAASSAAAMKTVSIRLASSGQAEAMRRSRNGVRSPGMSVAPSARRLRSLLYLGIRKITGRHIDGNGLVLERGDRGTSTYGWKPALSALAVRFGDRLPV